MTHEQILQEMKVLQDRLKELRDMAIATAPFKVCDLVVVDKGQRSERKAYIGHISMDVTDVRIVHSFLGVRKDGTPSRSRAGIWGYETIELVNN